MVSSGISMTAVVVAALVVAAAAEPGFLKGARRCHPKIVPFYHTVYDKVGHSGLDRVPDGTLEDL